MIVKCPQCNALLEAQPGDRAQCKECGFSGPVSGQKGIHARAQEIIAPQPVRRDDLWAPLAVLTGVGAVGTFYLARFYLPFLLAALAILFGLLSRTRTRATGQASLGIALGGAALVLQTAVLWAG